MIFLILKAKGLELRFLKYSLNELFFPNDQMWRFMISYCLLLAWWEKISTSSQAFITWSRGIRQINFPQTNEDYPWGQVRKRPTYGIQKTYFSSIFLLSQSAHYFNMCDRVKNELNWKLSSHIYNEWHIIEFFRILFVVCVSWLMPTASSTYLCITTTIRSLETTFWSLTDSQPWTAKWWWSLDPWWKVYGQLIFCLQ